MAHAFLNTANFNGDNNFYTQSAILKTKKYYPEVLFIGTYNDGNNIDNNADFFYGRNYFWPVMFNLANNLTYITQNQITHARRHGLNNGIPNPSLTQILNLCEIFKMSFADLIQNVRVDLPNHDDTFINTAIGNNLTENNAKSIIEFLNNNPSIKYVYSTTKFNNHQHIVNLWEEIKLGANDHVRFGCIRTPSGRGGFNGPLPAGIAKYWVWCNHPNNPHGPMQYQEGYTHINHSLLNNAGVNVNIF